MAFVKRAPPSLPRAVTDLVAEGGNVLASDDAPVSRGGAGAGSRTPPEASETRPAHVRADQPATPAESPACAIHG